MTDYPRYSYPLLDFIPFVTSMLMGKRRNFRQDALLCVARMRPPLRVMGQKHIPQTGPCVLTINHYYRPGFPAWWIALAVAAVVPADVHWIMTSYWRCEGKWYRPILSPITRHLFPALARLYGFTVGPAMPPDPDEVEARARTVRQVLAYVKNTAHPMVGLAPEGSDNLKGTLAWPPAGVGRFALLLAMAGLCLVPVGVCEAEGELRLNFGPAYHLEVPGNLPSSEKDSRAAEVIMRQIAALLPAKMRGGFGSKSTLKTESKG